MKVALCISGQMRTFDQCFDNLKKYILNQYECDIFIHTWDNRGISKHGNNFYINENDEITSEMLFNIYKPKKIIIENFREFKVLDKYVEISNMVNPKFTTFPMFYSQKCCNDLKNNYSQENNINYDFIIRMRPDLQLESFIPKYVLNETNVFWHQNHPTFVDWRTFDHFHISNKENMDIYCNAYDYMDILWDTPINNFADKYDGRWLQTINLNKHNIKVKNFNNYMYKIQRHDLGI